jgi:hypothetical protein
MVSIETNEFKPLDISLKIAKSSLFHYIKDDDKNINIVSKDCDTQTVYNLEHCVRNSSVGVGVFYGYSFATFKLSSVDELGPMSFLSIQRSCKLSIIGKV